MDRGWLNPTDGARQASSSSRSIAPCGRGSRRNRRTSRRQVNNARKRARNSVSNAGATGIPTSYQHTGERVWVPDAAHEGPDYASCARHFTETTARPLLPHPRQRNRPLRSRTLAAGLGPALNSASGVSNATGASAINLDKSQSAPKSLQNALDLHCRPYIARHRRQPAPPYDTREA